VRADETPQKENTHETFYSFDVRNRPGRRSVPCGPDPQHQRAGFAQHADGEKAQEARQKEHGCACDKRRAFQLDFQRACQKVVRLCSLWWEASEKFGGFPSFFIPPDFPT
jgi:hypothetical protein